MLVAAAVASAALVGLTPGNAFAQPTGYGLDGLWSDQTTCGSDAVTKRSATIVTSTQLGEVYGKLELRYSAKCRTVWARVTTPTLPIAQAATVLRNSDGRTMDCDGRLWSSNLNSYYCITAMLYDGGVTSYAMGWIARNTYEEPPFAETGSY
jgi:hypothetical protein